MFASSTSPGVLSATLPLSVLALVLLLLLSLVNLLMLLLLALLGPQMTILTAVSARTLTTFRKKSADLVTESAVTAIRALPLLEILAFLHPCRPRPRWATNGAFGVSQRE